MAYLTMRERPEEPPITPEKLISKMCFVKYGAALKYRERDLLKDMRRYWRKMEIKPVSRQAIKRWFVGDSIPRRNNALVFLNAYLQTQATIEQNSNYDLPVEQTLLRNRKKVHSQLRQFFRNNIDYETSTAADREVIGSLSKSQDIKVYSQSYGRVLIDVGHIRADFLQTAQSVEGVFILYRSRFMYSLPKYIAREVIQVFRKGRELRFKYWYLHEGTELSIFEGVVVVIGHSIWFIGANHRDEDRLRVLKFRYIASNSQKYKSVRWGIMLTDMPGVASPEPVACRILLMRAKGDIVNVEDFANKMVSNLEEGDIDIKIREIVFRAINNNNTAESELNSIHPMKDRDGHPINDHVLRVSQRTIDSIDYEFGESAQQR